MVPTTTVAHRGRVTVASSLLQPLLFCYLPCTCAHENLSCPVTEHRSSKRSKRTFHHARARKMRARTNSTACERPQRSPIVTQPTSNDALSTPAAPCSRRSVYCPEEAPPNLRSIIITKKARSSSPRTRTRRHSLSTIESIIAFCKAEGDSGGYPIKAEVCVCAKLGQKGTTYIHTYIDLCILWILCCSVLPPLSLQWRVSGQVAKPLDSGLDSRSSLWLRLFCGRTTIFHQKK